MSLTMASTKSDIRSKNIQDTLPQKLDSRIYYHPLFSKIRAKQMTREEVQLILGQYWHPITFFPTFLATAVANSNVINIQTYISKILFQELGEGNPSLAHPVVYLNSMDASGFDVEAIQNAKPLAATKALMDGFRKSLESEHSAYGFIYATELIDLALVSGIGQAVKDVSGNNVNHWIDIHVVQEPDHVASVSTAITSHISNEHQEEIVYTVNESLLLWISFLDNLVLAAEALTITAASKVS